MNQPEASAVAFSAAASFFSSASLCSPATISSRATPAFLAKRVALEARGTHYDGTTFAGSADGTILRFMEQATDLQVRAHPVEGNEPAKVTALCFDAVKHVLISSGDDGYLRMWDPGTWDTRRGGADIKPINQINFPVNHASQQ